MTEPAPAVNGWWVQWVYNGNLHHLPGLSEEGARQIADHQKSRGIKAEIGYDRVVEKEET